MVSRPTSPAVLVINAYGNSCWSRTAASSSSCWRTSNNHLRLLLVLLLELPEELHLVVLRLQVMLEKVLVLLFLLESLPAATTGGMLRVSGTSSGNLNRKDWIRHSFGDACCPARAGESWMSSGVSFADYRTLLNFECSSTALYFMARDRREC